MTNIKIVTDSTCSRNPELEKLSVVVVPLSVMVDDVVYITDETFENEAYMDMMKHAKALPKTSQPPIGGFAETFEELTKDGSIVISIHCTSKLSGTVESARQASLLVKGEVHVVDSEFIDQALAHQVIKAAQMAQKGHSVEEILEAIAHIRQQEKLFLGVSTLENLVKGGRVSKMTGLVSSMLNIKVVFELTKEGLLPVQKGRGTKVFQKWLEALISELKSQEIAQLGISYTGSIAFPSLLQEKLKEAFPYLEIPVLHTSPAISTHAGENAFAIMYYTV